MGVRIRKRVADSRTDTTDSGSETASTCARATRSRMWICGQNPRTDEDTTFRDPHISAEHQWHRMYVFYAPRGEAAHLGALPPEGTISVKFSVDVNG